MAISSSTATNMVLDAGSLYIDSVDIGATKGGSGFVVTQDIYFPELNGTIAPVKGMGKVVKERAALTVSVAEVTITHMARIMPTLASSSDATSEYTTTPTVGMIPVASHLTVEWRGLNTNGKDMILTLYNALPEGGVKLNFEDGGETTYEVTFATYADPAAPKVRNFKMAIKR